MKHKLKKVLVLGSGALKIGEAGEFDYSGSQALKALKEEGIRTVLINPNIATVQTSKEMADIIYFLPIKPDFVSRVIKKERPDGILLGFGGQTALNCGLTLSKKGVFRKYGVRVLGTPIETISKTEDRALFKKSVKHAGLKTPRSIVANSLQEARGAARSIHYPLILRAGYSLGGEGSTVVKNQEDLSESVIKILRFAQQVLVEEYLGGWKEIEYEIMRDEADNCIAVCNMENVDPMGIHTGESIVVAPSQTLNNYEYHVLRSRAISLVRSLGVVGECNVQFALDSASDDYRVIEMNARLSRSSALASKATGYPLAYVAAKLALGYLIPDLKNSITKVTSACFEPALDYIVVKIPRWDLKKFSNVSKRIGSEMKSVGEVMAIGRSFEEAFQKAIRMLDIGVSGFTRLKNSNFKKDLAEELREPTDERIFAIAEALEKGWGSGKIASLTYIDRWFIEKMKNIVDLTKELRRVKKLTPGLLLGLKKAGFSDEYIAEVLKQGEAHVRSLREKWHIVPRVKRIDTLAAEYPTKTNYLYYSYDAICDDKDRSLRKKKQSNKKVIILGSGPYKIGSSVEFDWCCVSALRTLRRLGYETIVINCNPETVSTDYDECDHLYFEELTLERVTDIYKKEKPLGIIVSMGGQIPNNLALKLKNTGLNILGTSAEAIHNAENRHTFSGLLDGLKIAQPPWKEFVSFKNINQFAEKNGYPVLVRPSYVLSGAAMGVAFNEKDLNAMLRRALMGISPERPVVVSKFITGAKEFEIDAIAQEGTLLGWALSEHVENAGVHSGDATMVFPAQKIYEETRTKAIEIAKRIAGVLKITGPFNIQFLAKNNEVMVIECNVRASRSFPFISKVSGVNFIDISVRAILGKTMRPIFYKQPEFVGVKAPQFSFSRLRGSDPVLTVEMTSTGEVACLGDTVEEALLKSLLATNFRFPQKKILVSLGGDENKSEFLESLKELKRMGFDIFTTPRTAEFFGRYGIHTTILYKPSDGKRPSVEEKIKAGGIDLVVNTSDEGFPEHIPDDYRMRRTAVDFNVPLITNIQLAKLFIRSLSMLKKKRIKLKIKSWNDCLR
jgi:carbamoyl-phosphate synthase large subunit